MHRWENNNKIDLQEEEWGMVWIDAGQNRDRWRVLDNMTLNLWVP